MPEYIIRVELHRNPNAPSSADYERLSSHMHMKNWTYMIHGAKGMSRLPSDMFQGTSEIAVDLLTASLRRGIVKHVWSDVTVLVIELKDWVMEPG